MIKLAKVNAAGDLEPHWAVLIALIGVIPALVTLGVNWVVKPADKPAIEREQAKLDLDKRKASAEVYKSALATTDPNERKKIVDFLMTAKLVDDNADVRALPADRIPQWPGPARPPAE